MTGRPISYQIRTIILNDVLGFENWTRGAKDSVLYCRRKCRWITGVAVHFWKRDALLIVSRATTRADRLLEIRQVIERSAQARNALWHRRFPGLKYPQFVLENIVLHLGLGASGGKRRKSFGQLAGLAQ
jgi:hypothetical protein